MEPSAPATRKAGGEKIHAFPGPPHARKGGPSSGWRGFPEPTPARLRWKNPTSFFSNVNDNYSHLTRQLRQRMRGLQGRLLDIVLATPVGGVRSEKLALELAHWRARLEFCFALIAGLALAAPAIGLVNMLQVAAVHNTAETLPWSVLLPLLFGTLVATPALLLLLIADHFWLSSLGQVNKHSTRLSRLPTGLGGLI